MPELLARVPITNANIVGRVFIINGRVKDFLGNRRIETSCRDVGSHAPRGQCGQCLALDHRVHRGRTLQARLSRVPQRNHAFPRGGGGFLCQRLVVRSTDQSSAAALREDLGYQ